MLANFDRNRLPPVGCRASGPSPGWAQRTYNRNASRAPSVCTIIALVLPHDNSSADTPPELALDAPFSQCGLPVLYRLFCAYWPLAS